MSAPPTSKDNEYFYATHKFYSFDDFANHYKYLLFLNILNFSIYHTKVYNVKYFLKPTFVSNPNFVTVKISLRQLI